VVEPARDDPHTDGDVYGGSSDVRLLPYMRPCVLRAGAENGPGMVSEWVGGREGGVG
jgi:hypothetical protein